MHIMIVMEHLVKYIESICKKLWQKYESFYLFRNERDVRIYSFENGNAFEPDFVLFLRRKGVKDVYDNIQIYWCPLFISLSIPST